MTALLELKKATKDFRGVPAIKDVDFTLERGEIHAIVGENGAGKSTLIKILCGIYEPSLGSLELDGRSGILGSHLPFGDLRRGWNFVSLGHGDVDFDKIIREANVAGYQGPLSVEWEDNGMDREQGAPEAVALVRRLELAPSGVAFDAAFKGQ